MNICEKFKPSGQVNFTYSIYQKLFGSNTPIYRLDLHYRTCLMAKILKQNVYDLCVCLHVYLCLCMYGTDVCYFLPHNGIAKINFSRTICNLL